MIGGNTRDKVTGPPSSGGPPKALRGPPIALGEAIRDFNEYLTNSKTLIKTLMEHKMIKTICKNSWKLCKSMKKLKIYDKELEYV